MRRRTHAGAAIVLTAMLAGPAIAQDADLDGIDDALDNCVDVANRTQVDADADGIGNACDCAPSDASETGRLGPSSSLRFDSSVDLAWEPPTDSGGGALVFDLLRSADPTDFSLSACIETDSVAPNATDPATPPPGTLFAYLTRAQGDCGGNLGADTAENRRVGSACPAGSPLPACSEAMDVSCPDLAPSCGATFVGTGGCRREFKGNCYQSGAFAYKVTTTAPLEILLDDDLDALDVFLATEGAATATMRFFDADNLEVDTPLASAGACDGAAMPPNQVRAFSRPVRRIVVTTSGVAWVDDFAVNP